MKEKDLCKTIIEFLNYQGYYCWRVNSGMIETKQGHRVKLNQAGTSDIQGIRKKDGRFICLEVKLPKTIKNVTELQRIYLYKMREYGAITGVVTSPDEALTIIERNIYEQK